MRAVTVLYRRELALAVDEISQMGGRMVGQVHLGVVHVLRAATDAVTKRESKITESGFKTLDELRAMRDRLETWSQICLDGVERLL